MHIWGSTCIMFSFFLIEEKHLNLTAYSSFFSVLYSPLYKNKNRSQQVRLQRKLAIGIKQ